MKRTLVLMRHAKALSYSAQGDRARELAPRGRQEARTAGLELAGKGIEHILCSASTRTRQTVEALGLRTPGGTPVPAEFLADLYLGPAATILQRIGEVTDDVTGLLVVGHSPGIPALAAWLAWTSSPQQADAIQRWFPTAAFSQFQIAGSWATLCSPGTGSPENGASLKAIARPGQATIQT